MQETLEPGLQADSFLLSERAVALLRGVDVSAMGRLSHIVLSGSPKPTPTLPPCFPLRSHLPQR